MNIEPLLAEEKLRDHYNDLTIDGIKYYTFLATGSVWQAERAALKRCEEDLRAGRTPEMTTQPTS